MEEKITAMQGKLLDMEKEQKMLSDSYQQLSVNHAETNEKCEVGSRSSHNIRLEPG